MNFDKVLIVSNAPRGTGLASYYANAFEEVLGIDKVLFIGEENRIYTNNLIYRAKRKIHIQSGLYAKNKMANILALINPEEKLLIWLTNTSDLRTTDIKKLSELDNTFLVHYIPDHPFAVFKERQKIIKESITYFDLVLTFSKSLLPVYYQLGAKNVFRLPFAYCSQTHWIDYTEQSAYSEKVAYFGTWSPPIEEWLSEIAPICNLSISGSLWENSKDPLLKKLGMNNKGNVNRKMAELANEAAVVINFTRATHGCFHTMKTFELPAAGACVLSNYSEEQDEFYPRNEFLYFNTKKELKDLLMALLAKPEQVLKIKKSANQYSKSNSYNNRLDQLMKYLNEIC